MQRFLRLRGSALFCACALALVSACGGGDSSAGADAPGGLFVQRPANAERPRFHDFGVVNFGDTVTHTFRLANTSDSPITIRDVLPNCRCTRARVTFSDPDGGTRTGNSTGGTVGVIEAGGRADLRVTLDSTQTGASNTHKLAQVRLRCDSAETPYLNFELHVYVEKTWVVVPNPLRFGRVGRTIGAEGKAEVVPSASFPLARVLKILEISDGLKVELDEVQLVGTAFTRVNVQMLPFLPKGPYSGKIVFQTTSGDGTGDSGKVTMSIRAMVSEDVYTTPAALSFPRQDPTQHLEARIELASLVPGQRLFVRETRIIGDHASELEAVVEPLWPDAAGRSPSWSVRLVPKHPLPPGAFSGVLHLDLDDSQVPHVSVPYRGVIQKLP